MNDVIVWKILVGAVVIFYLVAVFFAYSQKVFLQSYRTFFTENRAPKLWVPKFWFAIVLAVLILHYQFAPVFLPFWGILLALFSIRTWQREESPFRFWNIRWREAGRYLWQGVRLLALILFPLYLIAFLSITVLEIFKLPVTDQPAIERFQNIRSAPNMLFFAFNALVIAPVWEEITFRGFLYPMLKSKTGKWSAIVLTSVLFSAMHGHLPTFLPLFVLAVIFTLIYENEGSLGYPIALHALFNFFSAVLFFIARSI